MGCKKVYLKERQNLSSQFTVNYNGKYGTYTVRHKVFGLILDFNVSQVRFAGNLARVKLNGLK